MKYVKTTVSRVCPRHALRLYALPPPLYERLEQPGEATLSQQFTTQPILRLVLPITCYTKLSSAPANCPMKVCYLQLPYSP